MGWGGFVKGKLYRASDIWPESCTKTRDLLHEKKKKWEKRITEDEELVRNHFERNDCLMKDMKAFLVPVSLSAFPIGSHYPWPYNEIQCDADEMIPGLLLRFMNIFPWTISKSVVSHRFMSL